jgi:hypothetical protein
MVAFKQVYNAKNRDRSLSYPCLELDQFLNKKVEKRPWKTADDTVSRPSYVRTCFELFFVRPMTQY